ncbi:major facilitator superfamily domain-containing protein 6-like [Conger conger]|uniref:major facilitator superfamily domain-containing protein 6-like n=1 Tax=Conger conger TaxID=82655 RepID=UPI002A59D7DC|nr:major facilitator superfamily domain-containing protein 6-like [Conger conger]
MMRSNGQWDVKAASAHAGLFHFLYSCGRACLLPFLTLYLRYLGLTATMTGIAMATRCLVTLAWGPVSSLLAKRYNRRRGVVMGSLLGSAAIALLLLLLPPADQEAAVRRCNATQLRESPGPGGVEPGGPGHFTPTAAPPTAVMSLSLRPGGSSTSHLSVTKAPGSASTSHRVSQGPHRLISSSGDQQVASSDSNSSHSPALPERAVRSVVRGSKQGLEKEAVHYEFLGSLKVMDAQHQLFFLVLMGVALWEGASAPLERTVDDGLFEYLDFVDAADRHGSAQLWGLVGAAGGACGAGLLVGGLGCMIGTRLPSSAAHFFAYAALTFLAAPAAAFLPMYLSRKRGPAGRALKALRLVRGDPSAALSAATAFLAGAGSATVSDFLLWEMQDRGSSELHMGLALGAALVSQALFLLLLAPRAARFLSHGTAMSLGVASLGLQCLYYSFLWSPWSALPAQALSCLSAGALWWAVEGQCAAVATPGTERWVHGLVRETAAGLGAGLGSLAGGFTVDRFGVAVLFRGAAVVLLLWGLVLPVVLSRLPRRRRINYSRLLAADASEQSESESEPEQERDWLVTAMQEEKSTNNNNNKGHW